ncbi:MAG: type II toxin-antitoxin system VapC family toxin [Planctomycetes bacterium]|nr:type II toxin-antitoxin system VapC family toxin [Planctomycetota bacterium]
MTAPAAYVVDASVAIKCVVEETHSDQARRLFQRLADNPAALFWVPDLFYAECSNILWKRVRRGETTADVALKHSGFLRDLPLCDMPLRDLVPRSLEIALQTGSSVYDGRYVALAECINAPFITADEALLRKIAGLPIKACHLTGWQTTS